MRGADRSARPPRRVGLGRSIRSVNLDLPAGRHGVLACQHLERAIAAGAVHAGRFTIPEANIQPASLDLRLSEVAYRIRCSFLPGTRTVADRLAELVIDEIGRAHV